MSRDCNILSLKVLTDSGEGTVSDILNAIDRVLKYARNSGRRSVVSMSLGGPCEMGGEWRNQLVSKTLSLPPSLSLSFLLPFFVSFSLLYVSFLLFALTSLNFTYTIEFVRTKILFFTLHLLSYPPSIRLSN